MKYILWNMWWTANLKEWFPAYQLPPESERWMELYFGAHYEPIGF